MNFIAFTLLEQIIAYEPVKILDDIFQVINYILQDDI